MRVHQTSSLGSNATSQLQDVPLILPLRLRLVNHGIRSEHGFVFHVIATHRAQHRRIKGNPIYLVFSGVTPSGFSWFRTGVPFKSDLCSRVVVGTRRFTRGHPTHYGYVIVVCDITNAAGILKAAPDDYVSPARDGRDLSRITDTPSEDIN